MGIFDRTISLVGEENFNILKNKKVIVFGCGGVGGYVVEMLARSGLQNLTIVDFDIVNETNINRQIIATNNTIGKYKVDCFKERVFSINPNCNLLAIKDKLLPDNIEKFSLSNYDFVVDCIDMVTSKVELINYCYQNNIKIISSMGTGNRSQVPQLEITDIFKTENDGLAKILRKLLREKGVKSATVIYSKQNAKKQKVVASIAYYPASCGIMISAYVINQFLKEGEENGIIKW